MEDLWWALQNTLQSLELPRQLRVTDHIGFAYFPILQLSEEALLHVVGDARGHLPFLASQESDHVREDFWITVQKDWLLFVIILGLINAELKREIRSPFLAKCAPAHRHLEAADIQPNRLRVLTEPSLPLLFLPLALP